MAEVILKDIVKVYDGNVKAVDKVNIHVNDKEFVVLVGPSGCGKSTTLRMVAGLESITDGDCFIDGKRINDKAPKDRDIAMVFQNYALYPHMNVKENMSFGLRIRKFAKDEIEARVQEASQILDIEELLERKPKALSGGQRQRVAVGRAIVRKPKVFLFDEPLSNLDAKLRVQMRTEISSLHTRLQATMMYVTHDQVEAMTMGDKIVVMKNGLVQQIGSPLNLYNAPINKFVAGFMGSPPMNFLHGKLIEEGGKIRIKDSGLDLIPGSSYDEGLKPFIGKDIVFGVRPEDMDVSHKPKEGNNITANIDVIEPLGAETHLNVTTQQNQLTVRVGPNVDVKVGDEIHLVCNYKKIHFFDPETERSIFFKDE